MNVARMCVVICLAGLGLGAAEDGRLLSGAELAALDRENAMWRLVRPDEEVAPNLVRLSAAGFGEVEVKNAESRLRAWWELPMRREFGRLPAETVEKITEVDARYVARLRAARMKREVGVQSGEFKVGSPLQVSAQWRRAVLRVLEYDEIAEFALMNSEFARLVQIHAGQVELTTDERRTLIEWEREFLVVHGRPESWEGATPKVRLWHQRAQDDGHDRIRELLGDERAVEYLAQAHSPLDTMCDAILDETVSATALLDLWKFRREYRRDFNAETSHKKRLAMCDAAQAKAVELLGEDAYRSYAKQSDARWMFMPPVAIRAKR